NSCTYDHNPNPFDCPPDSYHPPYPTYETYSVDSYGNDSHFGYDFPPQFPLNYEPELGCIQNYNSYPHDLPSFPLQFPCCEDYGVTHEPYQCQLMNHDYYHEQNSCYDFTSIGFDQSQPQQYTVNHPIFNAHHDLLGSQKKLNITLTKVNEKRTSLTSICELACQIVQNNLEEKQLKEEQAAKAQNWKLPVCYDDDDDEESSNSLADNIISELPPYSAVTPSEPSTFDEDFPKKIYSNPFFDEEINPMKIDQHPFNAEFDLIGSMPNHDSSITISSQIDSLFDEFVDDPMPPGIKDDDYDSGRDIPILEELLDNYSLSLPANESYHFDIPSPYRPPAKPPDGNTGTLNIKMLGDVSDQKVPIPNLTITRALNQEKSSDLLSHQGLEAFQPSAECPMIINGKNIPLLDVPLFHFYPP
nr:hypothetical protein [Tanacetum cinerariifolium]